MRIVKENNVIDFARFAFESNNPKASYVCKTVQYIEEEVFATPDVDDVDIFVEGELVKKHIPMLNRPRRETINVFHCEHCGHAYDIKELKIKDNVIHCDCGQSIAIENLRPYDMIDNYYSSSDMLTLMHNIKNGTVNKLNVPVILRNNYFYCPECHKTEDIFSYKKIGGELICNCGAHYTFDECKIEYNTRHLETITGGLYFNDNKISISLVEQQRDLDHNDNYFWGTGTSRVTMNLETGYTFLSNTGCSYTETNKVWKRYNEGKAPKMFNATYCDMYWNHLNSLSSAKVREMFIKYANYPNLIDLINKNRRMLDNKIEKKLAMQIDEYMTTFLNKKFGYGIKSLTEIVKEEGDKTDKYDTLALFVRHNRFVNANYRDLKYNLSTMFSNIKSSSCRKAFRKLHRETNQPILDFINVHTPVSKSLRKKVCADYKNERLDWNDGIFLFVPMSQYITNKENLNKLYNLLKFKYCATYNVNDAIELWLKFRSEEYITNIKTYDEFNSKFWNMRDSIGMLNRIRNVYGDDWNEDSIVFHNEKQYHDALIEITRSQTFKDILDAKRRAEMSEPFKMEEEVFELQNKDITIALNEYELSKIGNEMHICVGGYGNEVRNHNCRIAYIKHNDEYIACLELRAKKNKNKSVVYELRQAKLKYNNFVGTNETYYKIVSDWCEDNQIKIETKDMEPNFKNRNLDVEF